MRRLLILLLALAPLVAAQNRESRPKPQRRQAEITLRVVEASSAQTALNDAAELVPAELRNLLRFSRYHLLDTAIIRGTEGEKLRLGIAGDLRADIDFTVRGATQPPGIEYDVHIYTQGAGDQGNRRLLETTVTGVSGEAIVLGASRMKDGNKALVVILTGKLLQ